jgi:tRNA pseudouridine13 synthase
VKLKATPQDFIVEEEAAAAVLPREAAGPSSPRAEYAVFQLSKTSWDTFDLVDLLARRWGVPREAIGLGGFKDRHGSTVQRISVRGLKGNGPNGEPASIEEKNFRAAFAGWSDRPLSAREIRGNRFRITARDLTPQEAARIHVAGDEVSRFGFPNYYDSQRFGSARHGAGFMGKEMFLGKREKALRLYFTPSKHDDRKTR